jgi:MFS family permease
MLLLAAAMALLAGVDGATPIVRVALCLGLVGFGSGLFTAPNNSALMGAAPKGRQGIAAGVMALARNVGMSLGVGLAGAIMTTVMAHGPGADSLFRAVSACTLTAAAIAAAGAVTSYVRER